ncbi:MAG: FAD-dependent oxidoreductase [Candidatus Peribacteria bacterium]|nr:MAG: FAD-dependent oxidoreductase [Candidatus Peribacteria bacterium]
MTLYDLIIIGTGSAGLPAGMYASRYKIKNLVIGGQPGGALATSHKVENYPGTISAPGKEIMDKFKEHAEVSGSEILQDIVTEVQKDGDVFTVKTAGGKELTSKYVVLATGNKYRHLGFEGEDAFLGKGVSYCATCDGMFFRDRDVVIVGGGNTALTEALYLAEICNKVYLVHRRDTFRAEDIWVEQAKKHPKIEMVLNEEVESVSGAVFMEDVNLKSGKVLKADGIFVAIGSDPDTKLVAHMHPEMDEEGCLIVDKRQQTSIKGLYAAGDVTTNSNKFKQTIMSAAEGCLAANSIHEDILRG